MRDLANETDSSWSSLDLIMSDAMKIKGNTVVTVFPLIFIASDFNSPAPHFGHCALINNSNLPNKQACSLSFFQKKIPHAKISCT